MIFSRNNVFTGREEDLIALAKGVFDRGGPTLVTQSITGIGGIGKTQLAVEFCYRYGRYFHGVHWIDAAPVAVKEGEPALPLDSRVEGELASCGETMMLPDWPEKQPEQVKCTLAAWAHSGPRLVVLDNLEDVAGAREVIQILKDGGDLRILITARHQDWPKDLVGVIHRLDVFSKEESLIFLRKTLSDESLYPQGDLEKLAERLGYLPLALELAGRYLHRMKLGVPGYLEKLDAVLEHPSMSNWRSEYGNPTDHDLSLRGTFLVSWEGVTEKNACKLFMRMVWCAPNEPIPLALLGEAIELDEGNLREALIELEDAGLIGCRAGVLEPTLHPLVGEFGQMESRAAHQTEDLEIVAEVLQCHCAAANQSGYPQQFEPFRGHIEAVAEYAEVAGLKSADRLWNSLGYHLDIIANYTGARQMYERALAIDEAAFGPKHPNVGTIVNNLGSVLQEMGDYDGARRMFERALDIDEATLGREHPDIAVKVNNLGMALQDMGDYDGARQMVERALTIDETTFGPQHPEVAVDVNNLGSVLHDMGDYIGARQMYEQALAINEAAFGREHPIVGRAANNLGCVLQDMGDYGGARRMFERALGIFEQHLGVEHPNVGALVNNLGGVLQALGDYDGALQMYERALIIDEAAFGHDHPDVAIDSNNLGGVLQELGDYDGARQMYERALKIFEKSLPPDHPNIKLVKDNIKSLDQ